MAAVLTIITLVVRLVLQFVAIDHSTPLLVILQIAHTAIIGALISTCIPITMSI